MQTTVEEVINELYRLDCYGQDRVVDAFSNLTGWMGLAGLFGFKLKNTTKCSYSNKRKI